MTTNGASSSSGSSGSTAAALQQDADDLTSPAALRKIILNYLVHHCYLDTAQALADDGISSLDAWHTSPINTAAASSSSSAQRPASGVGGATSNVAADGHPASSSARASSHNLLGSAHPLSAPPLSRENSSMEIEVDSLLTLAQPDQQQGTEDTTARSTHVASVEGREPVGERSVDEDVDMAGRADERKGASAMLSTRASETTSVNNSELSLSDLHVARVRKEIRDHIINGRIKLAIELLNTQFPTVLNASEGGSATKSSMKKRDGAERRAPSQSGLSKSRERSEDKSQSQSQSQNRSQNQEEKKVLPSNPTSLDPAHLSLNLQIQVFIESVRSVSAGSTGSVPEKNGAGLTAHSVASSQPGIASAAAAVSRSASPAPSSTSSHESMASANGLSSTSHSTAMVNPTLNAALAHAQMLYTSVQTLPGFWRSMYLKELETVTALLAYRDLESSPLRKYLDQSRRVALAEQINSAILFRSGKPSQPLIESAVRQTTFLWTHLSLEKVPVPLDSPLLKSGTTTLGLDKFDTASSNVYGASTASSATTAKNQGSSNGSKNGRILPPFDLHSFLSER